MVFFPPSLVVAFQLLIFARVIQLSVKVFGQWFCRLRVVEAVFSFGTILFLCEA